MSGNAFVFFFGLGCIIAALICAVASIFNVAWWAACAVGTAGAFFAIYGVVRETNKGTTKS